MITRSIRAVRALATAAALALLAPLTPPARADGPVDFARLAPPKPVIVVNIPDFTRLRERFERSELGKLWDEPGVKAFVEEVSDKASKRLGEFLKELGAESKDLKPPTGAVGLAMYLPPGDKAKGAHKFEPYPFVVADAGENAASWKDLIEKLIERGVSDKELTVEEDTYAGVKVQTLKPTYKEPEAAKPKGEDDEEDAPPPQPKGFAGFVGGSKDHPEALHVAWNGNTLVASTNLKHVEGALDGLQGREIESLSSDAAYTDSLAQHPADSNAFVAVDLGRVISESMKDAMEARRDRELGPPPVDHDKVLEYVGLGRMGLVSLGVRLDTDDALVDTSIGVLVPEKKGIFSLLSDPLGAFDPPGFVPADAAGVTRVSFRFDKLYDLIRGFAPLLPEEDRAQFSAVMEQGVNLVKPALDTAGPGVHMVATYRTPLASDSQQMVVAIDVKDQGVVSNTLTFFTGQAGGMVESREFEGNTIYTSEAVGMSLGVGFGRVFIGNTPAVENAMRLAGRADAPKIGQEPGFKEAARAVSPEAMMQSFSDMAQTLRFQYWVAQNADKEYEKSIDELGLDEETRTRLLKNYREHRPTWPEKLPPLETILAHIGDSVSEMRPTPDGFRGRTLILRPGRK
jgi:hypothetical protein